MNMTDYDKELEAFLIKIGQVAPVVVPTPKPVTKKDEE
jgi:hypothetical protein